jgi:hypothetical protein
MAEAETIPQADLFARALPIAVSPVPDKRISVTRCSCCGRPIGDDEMVYRLAVSRGLRKVWGIEPGLASICADCSKGKRITREFKNFHGVAGLTETMEWISYLHIGVNDPQWRDPRRCRSCGRWVVYTGRRPLPRSYAIVCSARCQKEAYAAHRAVRYPLQARPCSECGRPFTPKRRDDATLCSPRCKQAAYRARRR